MTSEQLPVAQAADLNTAKVEDTSDPLPIEGAHVITADGDTLGTAGEIRGEYFKVEGSSWLPDFWLPLQRVSSTTGGVVNLTFAKGALDDYKADEPAAA
jgi:hypothetical protein